MRVGCVSAGCEASAVVTDREVALIEALGQPMGEKHALVPIADWRFTVVEGELIGVCPVCHEKHFADMPTESVPLTVAKDGLAQ